MDLDTFIIAVFCLIDDTLTQIQAGKPIRCRGPAPVLADSEVLTMELVGEFLGLDQDKAIYCYFRRHYGHFFPAILKVHRTTFVRQAANLWFYKQRLWQDLAAHTPHDPNLSLVDSFPIPVCQFARAYRCHRFLGEAAYGYDELCRQTFYGFRCHVRLSFPGLITSFSLAPGNAHELAVLPELLTGSQGIVVGDRNYWSPRVAKELDAQGISLEAPFRSAKRDPQPQRSRFLSRLRYRIDTVFGQLVERYHAKKVWARDTWHLCSRLLRKVLSHTVAVLLNVYSGNPPLQLERLVAF